MAKPTPNLLAEDLDHILTHTKEFWEELRNQKIFITGGTGFFGCWLLESFAFANEKLGLGASVVVLTRNQSAFRKKVPYLADNQAISFYEGDVRTFAFPKGDFSYIIHAATDASAKLNEEDPLLIFDTIVEGTRHVLDFARVCGTKKFLLTSSGAVYGKQPPEVTHIPDDYAGGPNPVDHHSAYGEGKRVAEFLCAEYGKLYGIEAKVARCFAFVGPYLPLDIHYAIGNFIKDGLNGKHINVKGDGTPCRSYLYAADLAVWLWTILFMGKPGTAYNVGSEREISIRDLADLIAQSFSLESKVLVARTPGGGPPERYVPATEKARKELGLSETVDLGEAIERTKAWHLSGNQRG
jgi:dTDP-glucose 4,6-dehydratase